jgi:NAD+ synthase (glutamine-hydrolysing)
MKQYNFRPRDSYFRVATIKPEVAIGQPRTNARCLNELYDQAEGQQASLVVSPEMSLTGYSLGDTVRRRELLDEARAELIEMACRTNGRNALLLVGLPLAVGNRLYNCAALLGQGQIYGVTPKTELPEYGEFYDRRYFDRFDGERQILPELDAPFGNQLIYQAGGVRFGVEICEDAWVNAPPNIGYFQDGAHLVVNPSASTEQVGKSSYRRNLVASTSARGIGGYVYAGADYTESTADTVMSGHQIIASNGQILGEIPPFAKERVLLADIDITALEHDRMRQHFGGLATSDVIKTGATRRQANLLNIPDAHPFLPRENDSERRNRLAEIIDIQSHGLLRRLESLPLNHRRIVLGLSGGLDSTLALLVAKRTENIMRSKGLIKGDSTIIDTLTMPGPASSERTQNNAARLATALSVNHTLIPIGDLVDAELGALNHDPKKQDVTFENVQARARTSLLFNYANQHGGIVLGTGDLSEIALGWCTYNADQQSHYNVNASIPKTLVRTLVEYLSGLSEFERAKVALSDILETPISPELTGNGQQMSQSTESIIGPYELHDFFLFHRLRYGSSPDKIQFLAEQAFAGVYKPTEIAGWLDVFLDRFQRNQFKRENMPNGPKVGSVSLSPRGDWRCPPEL